MNAKEINQKIRAVEQTAIDVMEDCVNNREKGISSTNLTFLKKIIPFLSATKGKFIECDPEDLSRLLDQQTP